MSPDPNQPENMLALPSDPEIARAAELPLHNGPHPVIEKAQAALFKTFLE